MRPPLFRRVLDACLVLLLFALVSAAGAAPQSWLPLEAAVRAQIAAGRMPGAVVLVGDADGVRYRGAFGLRRFGGEAMSEDTVFDLASLTKAVATTTAVMQLVEAGRIALDEPVAHYWPAFALQGKAAITVRQLLAHTSGLPADLSLAEPWRGRDEALRRILATRPLAEPGRAMRYSDINFLVLGVLVERVSGQPLDAYCREAIFLPLGMNDTGFLPGDALRARAAPTRAEAGWRVHDPTAERMGGVAGHAGLFSTADDLARFARALLNDGRLDGRAILRRDTVDRLYPPQSPTDAPRWRGLGWLLEAPLVANRDALPPVGLIAHTGFTGTGLWIDRVTGRFVVILANRVYPDDGGDAGPLRQQVLALLSSLEPPRTPGRLAAQLPMLASSFALPPPARPERPGRVATGIDVLEARGFAPLAGLRVGLVTSLSAVDAEGWRTLDRLRWAPGVSLRAIFSPEHGLFGDSEGKQSARREPFSGLPVYSLYGETRRPTPAMLRDLDALVFDIQDAGVRFYTYETTLAYAMEAAAARGLRVFVLDRPNPLGGARVDGPTLAEGRESFTGALPMPVQHGLTIGEFARLYKAQRRLDVDLTVIAMQGWRRELGFEGTGLSWTPPSPNLRTLNQVRLYPGVALVEGANVSVGRGTGRPFEQVGAPWIDGGALARELTARAIPGVRVEPVDFVPNEGPYRNEPCHGVRFVVSDRAALRAPLLGVELASALWRAYPRVFRLDKTLALIGTPAVVEAIRRGDDPRAIEGGWQADLARFERLRAPFLLY